MATDSGGGLIFPRIELPSSESSPEAVVGYLTNHLVRLGRISHEHAADVACQVLHCESLGSTAIGNGVAVPHSKSDFVGEVVGVVGHSSTGIQWSNAIDDKPVHRVCLLLTPTSRPSESMQALKVVVNQLCGGTWDEATGSSPDP